MGLAAPIVAALIGGGASAYQGHRAREQQRNARRDAQRNAESAAADADTERRRADQRQPSPMNLLASAQEGGSGGLTSTLLTGSGGVDPDTLRLGRSTLLGT